MSWTYVVADVGVKVQSTIRSLIHDTKTDRQLLQDEEILAQLKRRGFALATSDPTTNWPGTYLAAADCADIIAAKFASESEIAITNVGAVKSNASGSYAALARHLREQGASDAKPNFVNPSDYDITYVEGVDCLPDPE